MTPTLPSWLEAIDGEAPLLLIAPHGGRCGAAARATLHPKVNDLETAAITRELAERLNARALINAGMDRNEVDCNRLSQLATHAPSVLDLIEQSVCRIVEEHGHATVLLIHGWNVIEPRVDLGLGLRSTNGRLRPPAGAHVSASDRFINGTVAPLSARLAAAGVIPTFGLRYPGGASQNLLQAFTQRHAGSEIGALRRLAALAARGDIDALQLEMSVAVRMPGAIRARSLDAMAAAFAPVTRRAPRTPLAAPVSPALIVERKGPSGTSRKSSSAQAAPSVRAGIEFYDAAARIGGMASFDFGAGAAGARIMMLFDDCRAALFTGEGTTIRNGSSLRLGPLDLGIDAQGGILRFHGPAVIVNDGAAYLSVENALAQSELDPAMMVEAAIDLDGGAGDGGIGGMIERALGATAGVTAPSTPGGHSAVFGRLRGTVVLGGVRRKIDAVARIGGSFTGLEPARFQTRRMLWASFPGATDFTALEARSWTFAGDDARHTARLLCDREWHECEMTALELETPAPGARPDRISAAMVTHRGDDAPIHGVAEAFMTLSRPGPDRTRIHTSIGFARYRVGDVIGAGMFEYSRVVDLVEVSGEDGDDSD